MPDHQHSPFSSIILSLMSSPSPTTSTEKPGALHSKTLAALDARRKTTSLFAIAEQSHVPFYWLRKFAAGAIANPSVNRVEQLFNWLTASKSKA